MSPSSVPAARQWLYCLGLMRTLPKTQIHCQHMPCGCWGGGSCWRARDKSSLNWAILLMRKESCHLTIPPGHGHLETRDSEAQEERWKWPSP